MTERVRKAIDIFLDALNEGTLAKGTCTACAVGNLVAHGMGGKITQKIDKNGYPNPVNWDIEFDCNVENYLWGKVFKTTEIGQVFSQAWLKNSDIAANISATDFTWEELAKIEYAFETSTHIYDEDYLKHSPEEVRADQIKGLSAVIQVLFEMDNIDASVEKEFTEKANKVPLYFETVI